MHSQQYNNNMIIQRQGNSQGQVIGVDQGHYQAQMQNIQPQQHIQQMVQYPVNPPQLINISSTSSSQSSSVNPSSQRVNSQNLQYKQNSQQINMSQQQQQVQVQGDSYVHPHQLQNQQVQQIQQPNQLNQLQSSSSSGSNNPHQQQFSHHSSQQSQQQPIQPQLIQNQGQLNFPNSQSQQQGVAYIHPNVSTKQQQPNQVQQQQIPLQLSTSQSQQQQYSSQQDSRRNSSRSEKNSQVNCTLPSQPQQQSLVFTNQGGVCSDKNGPYGALEQFVEPIYEDFVYLTEKILDKTMKSANKQLQDTLMNYFLENHVSNLIIKEMNCISKRAVRYEIEKTMQKNKTAKYMNLLNAFESKVKQFGKEKAYENLLMQLITDENSGSKQSEQWKTLVRKRILALLLYIHWSTPNAENIFNDFFAIWDLIYPNHPLPQKVKKSAQGGAGSNNQVSSQLTFQNQNQQPIEKPSNPNKAMKRSKQKIIENMNLSQTSLSSQATNFNSQSTSLFQNTYTSSNQRTAKESKITSSQSQASSELHRSSVKSEKDVPSISYSDMSQYGGQYQQQQGVVYQNQRNQIYINSNHQQNLNDGIPLQQTSSGFYSNQSNQQYDYNQNYYGNQQSSTQNYDQNYMIQTQPVQQQQQTNMRPQNQIFKGRMRSQSWDDLNNKKDEYSSPQNIQSNNLINQQQQSGYYNQQQAHMPTYYQQTSQPYTYDQVGEYYDPNQTNQYSHPQLIQQNSQGYYTDYQNNIPQQPQQQLNIPNRRSSNNTPQQVINDPNQQQQIQNQSYGYSAPNSNYQHQQYQQNQNYHNNYSSSNQQYQQVQKIPFYQNNQIYDIQEVKQEGTPSSQNTQESNNNQFFHMDKIILPDPESPEQRLKRVSQTNPSNNYTPLNSNSRTRYSLQYNQQEGSIMQFHQQQLQQSQGKNTVQQQQQFQQTIPNQNLSGQKVQYDQSGGKYNQASINNTKQEEDLYSSQSNYSVSSSQKSRSAKANKSSNSKQNYEASSGNEKYSENSQANKNGNYIIAKQEDIDQVNNGESQNDTQSDFIKVDQQENNNKVTSAQQSAQQQPTKGKDQKANSPSIIVTQQNSDSQSKLQQIQLHPAHNNQLQKQKDTSNSKRNEKSLDKPNQNIYQQSTINEDDKEDSMPRCQNEGNGSSDEYYQAQNDDTEAQISQNNQAKTNQTQADTQNDQDNGSNLNQNPIYRHPSKERAPIINNNLFQDFQHPEDIYLNPSGINNINNNLLNVEDKFIRNSQRQNTGASCMSIESEKTPFKRSETRNMTGLSNISIESDKEGRTPSQINRSKFFFRHQNSLEFPAVFGVRSNVRQGTAISNISDGLGANDMIGSQTNINQFFQKRSNFKQFSGISHISIEGGEFNYLQMMQTSNQSQNFGNIQRSQLRKRTNLSVDSLASFNIKPDKDLQNLSFDLENLSIHNQQLDNNGQILQPDTINENSNILDDKQNNNIFYNYSPNNEILP
ncbi:hypothetical protein TTHERM_00841250 (macronuclear) [Tetrahymena thermophila SB210]|uniref:Uncharacterized protein n=1 Tax=Tetrahymena thermophila (strain SB210) TaxID=312017 RepID=I7LXY6_TETTS|nr:hypothetical protein TTHERM_00841250 [Tetrahymena thermophila SB210]EAS06999.2 hypothetical protein TTHERM_00841250 [Tetrahymena thermophila SB210]|eukprot:XP_001027241.2 hypothetical protein TTHERM_00841250 [Tetrahymena thermophila SB210]